MAASSAVVEVTAKHFQADVVERRGVNRWLFLGIERLHQIELDLERAASDGADILVHIFPLAAESARNFQSQYIHPELSQAGLVGPADGDLLNP